MPYICSLDKTFNATEKHKSRRPSQVSFTQLYFEQNSAKKYHLKLSKDGKEFDEEVEIDTKNETEIFHVPKTSPKEAAGDMVYDFKKVNEKLIQTMLSIYGNFGRPIKPHLYLKRVKELYSTYGVFLW